MEAWKGGLLAGSAVGGYFLYQWWQKQREIDANMNEAAASGVQEPTQAQQENPAFWERIARDVVAGVDGMGALPPWPGIGPRPPFRLGPVFSLTPFSTGTRR